MGLKEFARKRHDIAPLNLPAMVNDKRAGMP
jgi:hypothetical protein